MNFTIYGKPQGKARARTFYNPKLGRSQSVTPEKTVLYENYIKQCFLEQSNPSERWFEKEPIKMTIIACFEIPKSTSKKDRERIAGGKLFPTKKPDADNIAKVICDALNGVAYGDDTQIISLTVCKVYTNGNPCVNVNLKGGKDEK